MTSPPPLPWSLRTAPERTVLLVASVTLGVILCWMVLGRFYPEIGHCGWKSLTGRPCLGCGGTRSLWALVYGHGEEAFLMNPGVFLLALLGVVLVPYAGSVVFFKFSPWRPSWALRLPWRWLLLSALAVNWIYLLIAGRV